MVFREQQLNRFFLCVFCQKQHQKKSKSQREKNYDIDKEREREREILITPENEPTNEASAAQFEFRSNYTQSIDLLKIVVVAQSEMYFHFDRM